MSCAGSGGGDSACVTGGSGFIGSWLVHLLLNSGYSVHATVQNLDDECETKHLQALDGAVSKLCLYQIDLFDPSSIKAAVAGTVGVFHLASPMKLHVQDPEKDLLDPALNGTLNVLRAAKDCRVKRVVVVSSTAAMTPNPSWPACKVIQEDSWADIDFLKKMQLWYRLSKTLAEKAAWEFAETEKIDLVVINPGMVTGPILGPLLNASIQIVLQLLQGDSVYVGCVDVRDLVQALILLYEHPSAQGRHLCVESIERWGDFVDKVAELYPEFPIKRVQEDKQSWLVKAKNPSNKLITMGVSFTPLEKTIRDTVEHLRSKGWV